MGMPVEEPVDRGADRRVSERRVLKGPWPFYEFFAGAGLARLGLGPRWTCAFANEISEKKARVYRLNFGPSAELLVRDVRGLRVSDVPGDAMLAWASFPCQDLSLAGNGAGLAGERSGTFWAFWRLVAELRTPLVAVENVPGLVQTHAGRDFRCLLEAMAAAGYRVGGLIVDAAHFVPQSRPRLFVVAVREDMPIPQQLMSDGPVDPWHNGLRRAADALGSEWIWWNLPTPGPRRNCLADLILDGEKWHTAEETRRIVGMMSRANLDKLEAARAAGKPVAGTVYKRIRMGRDGNRVQRAEVRFDQMSGCLRTPSGGSSREILMVVEGRMVRTRLLAPREAARLMGVPDTFVLPAKYNEAYHAMGDGLAVPVVEWLETGLLGRLAAGVG